MPVLGYLDDLLLVPLGIAIALRMIPAPVLADARERATAFAGRPTSRAAGVVIVAIWVALALGLGWLAWRAWAA